MGVGERFDEYLDHLALGLGHVDRTAGLRGYCTGLMLPLARKSVEPIAARVDPMHASAKHQALHHFVAQAAWSDEELLRRVCQWVVPKMDFRAGAWWIIDDTGFPKCVFRPIVTARFGIVTSEFGIVTGGSGDVTDRVEDRCEAGSRHVKGSAVGVAH